MQMDLSTGVILDRYTIANDCIDLTNNNGAYLYDNLLAVLAVCIIPSLQCCTNDRISPAHVTYLSYVRQRIVVCSYTHRRCTSCSFCPQAASLCYITWGSTAGMMMK
jgi:hypothetical protein